MSTTISKYLYQDDYDDYNDKWWKQLLPPEQRQQHQRGNNNSNRYIGHDDKVNTIYDGNDNNNDNTEHNYSHLSNGNNVNIGNNCNNSCVGHDNKVDDGNDDNDVDGKISGAKLAALLQLSNFSFLFLFEEEQLFCFDFFPA